MSALFLELARTVLFLSFSFSLVLCPPTLIPSSNNMISITSLLLKADPCLDGDVADEKADPSVCLQLNQISVKQYFLETAGSMDHQPVLGQAVFF